MAGVSCATFPLLERYSIVLVGRVPQARDDFWIFSCKFCFGLWLALAALPSLSSNDTQSFSLSYFAMFSQVLISHALSFALASHLTGLRSRFALRKILSAECHRPIYLALIQVYHVIFKNQVDNYFFIISSCIISFEPIIRSLTLV